MSPLNLYMFLPNLVEEEEEVEVEETSLEEKKPQSEEQELEEGTPETKDEKDNSDETELNEEGTEKTSTEPKMVKKIVKVKKMKKRDAVTLHMSVDKLLPEMNDVPIAFFVRATDGNIPKSSSSTSSLESHLEFNFMAGDVLYGIANLMHQVYLPVVQKPVSTDGSSSTTDIDEGLRHELDSNMTKFEQQLRHVVQQVQQNSVIFSVELYYSSNLLFWSMIRLGARRRSFDYPQCAHIISRTSR